MSDSAPSIGRLGAVEYDHHNDRVKAVVPVPAMNNGHLLALLGDVAGRATHGTRLNIRVPIAHDVDPRAEALNWQGYDIALEAFVPLRGHKTVAGLAYYGANAPRRRPSEQTTALEDALFMRVLKAPYKPVPTVEVDELRHDNLTETDVRRIVDTYKRSYSAYLTDFTHESVRAMVAGSRVLVVRDRHGLIVSVCVAESVTFEPRGHEPFGLVEISDAATDPAARGHGYYTAAKRRMIELIRANQDRVPTMVTTEARANSGKVLRSNTKLEMVYAGYQPMQCVLSSANDCDVPQDGKYANLRVFYAPY